MSRTVFTGKVSNEQKKIYETVRVAQEKSFEYLLSGGMTHASHVDQVARDYVMKNNYPNFPHSSHGIGIEIHEAPSLSPASTEVIKLGMVFSVEPGIYIPGFMGVRIEDIVTMTGTGPKIFTTSPREIINL